ncbi:UNVERIFIED_CONTAM: hypothetical protein RF653_16940 [Kocuria sp. CPCC 205316]|uniref:hypothetical protein n=1 Tax=Kocuria TaxID=57493 RepID=UPI0036DF2722
MSPRAKRTLGQKLIREFVLLTGAVIVAAITMTLVYQVITNVVAPELTDGLASAPPGWEQEQRPKTTSPMYAGTENRLHDDETRITVAMRDREYRGWP